MTLKFLSPSPLMHIQTYASKSRGLVAVPFLGKGAATLLPLKAGSTLITRMNEIAVKQGLVDPSEVVKLIRRGVTVHNCSNLHAKVYVFGKRVFVGSANVSKSSLNQVEAAIECTEPKVVADATRFLVHLCVDKIDIEYAQSLVPLYPSEKILYTPNPGKKGPAAQHSQVWVYPTRDIYLSDEAFEVDRKVILKVEKKRSDPAKDRLEVIEAPISADSNKISVGDRIVMRTVRGKSFELDPPARVVHIEHTKDASLMYVELPKRLKPIPGSQVRKSLKELSESVLYETKRIRPIKSQAAVNAYVGLWPALVAAN